MQKINKYKSIFLVNAEPIKNAGNIKEYFINNTESFIAFHFPMGYSESRPFYEIYKNGKIYKKGKLNLYRGNRFIIKTFLNHFYFYYVAFFRVRRKSILITNAPLFLFGNLSLRVAKNIKPVLWLGDYYPDSKFPMNFYNYLVKRYNRKLKTVIYLNQRLKDVYKINKKEFSKRPIINLGIKRLYKKEKKLNSKNLLKIGFIGVIRKGQGLDLTFKLLSENNNYELEVVGNGYDLKYYKDLSRKLNIEKKVKFWGIVENISPIFAKWNLAIALYENSADNLSKYAEPTKIKDYLSYGLPVITTSTTYFGEEIEKYSAGVVVKESVDDLKNGIETIKENYDKYALGASKIVEKYEYESWYDQKFSFLNKL